MDLSIVILSFRDREKLRETIKAVYRSETTYSYEVIVVDNDSKDGSAEMVETEFPQVILIRNINNGFAAGNNVGIRRAQGKYILLLNPDTEVMPNTLQECIKKMEEDPEIGMLGCKVLRPDGDYDYASKRNIPDPMRAIYRYVGLSKLFPHSKHFTGYNVTKESYEVEGEMGSGTGAFLMTKREVIDKIGMLDEAYFLYWEDMDWFYTCAKAGYKVWYFPKVKMIHHKGISSRKTPTRALLAFHTAMWIFYKKHYAPKYLFFINWLAYLAVWFRFAVLYTINLFRKNPYVSK
jgi:GT2 family glycosyltransferase